MNRAPAHRGLILLPTRELALQTKKAFESMAAFTHLKCGLIIGGEAFKYQIADIRKNPEVIIATPGRLVEHIEKGSVDFHDIEVLVLDEADRMLDMGFADDIHTIAKRLPITRQTLLFSATLTHIGVNEVSRQLKEPVRLEIDSHTHGHSDITQERILVDNDKHKANVIAALIEEEQPKRVFIFCKTRDQCENLSNILRYKKFRSGYIHGELAQSVRKQVLNQFKDDKLQIIVATDVAARGLDIDEVDLVINYTVAHSGDDHVHRVGRTGRSGNAGKAVTLVGILDWNLMSSIERYLKIRLKPRRIKGLEAAYTGPKKVKASGKAAGVKKPKIDGKKPAAKRPKKTEARKAAMSTSSDGSAPLKRRT
ncbi:MAG: DEAD/DEAH box helicase [Marinagarivorans sp.]|nr:DEAD/DEAH box helicase [Marinagarivorans sp.]